MPKSWGGGRMMETGYLRHRSVSFHKTLPDLGDKVVTLDQVDVTYTK